MQKQLNIQRSKHSINEAFKYLHKILQFSKRIFASLKPISPFSPYLYSISSKPKKISLLCSSPSFFRGKVTQYNIHLNSPHVFPNDEPGKKKSEMPTENKLEFTLLIIQFFVFSYIPCLSQVIMSLGGLRHQHQQQGLQSCASLHHTTIIYKNVFYVSLAMLCLGREVIMTALHSGLVLVWSGDPRRSITATVCLTTTLTPKNYIACFFLTSSD